MPTDLWRLLAQLSGTGPSFEGGPGGRPPTPVAPTAEYPEGGGGRYSPPDFGFDLAPLPPYGHYTFPRPAWTWSQGPLGPYAPPTRPVPWEQAGGPLDPYNHLDNFAASSFPPPDAHVWGVPLMSDLLRQYWLEQARRGLEWDAPGHF
jgi:hypothetical protein